MAAEQVVEQITEEVAEHLEEAAVVTRRINPRGVGFFLGGAAVGLAIGFVIGYRWNKEKIRAEAFAESEEEVERIRQQYREQLDSVKVTPAKKPLEEVVEERGYSVVEIDEERPLKAPVPGVKSPVHIVERQDGSLGASREESGAEEMSFEPSPMPVEKTKDDGWNFAEEVAKRSEEHPYIIHQDEFAENQKEYNQVTYTYYALDQILTDESEDKVDDQDGVVGVHNLHNFGHGADDYDVVFVRNDRLRLEFEICLTDQSYEEEVLGIHDDKPN